MHTYAIPRGVMCAAQNIACSPSYRKTQIYPPRRFAHQVRVNLPSPATPGHVGGYPATHTPIDYVVLREKPAHFRAGID